MPLFQSSGPAKAAIVVSLCASLTSVGVHAQAAPQRVPLLEDVPVPVARPPEFRSTLPGAVVPATQTPPPEAPPALTPHSQEADDACAKIAADGLVEGEPQADRQDGPLCALPSPLLLKAILLENGARVELVPPALVNCAMAGAAAQWLRSAVQPQLAKDNLQLTKLEIAGAYECRGRNRVVGAKMSEHATGNALDIRAFVTSTARRFEITRQSAEVAFFQGLKTSACLQFRTILGPGSDGYHQDHLHLDLQQRGNGSHFCQWVVE